MVHMLRVHPSHLLNFEVLHCNFPVHSVGRIVHDADVLKSTTIAISSVFAVIFWVVVRICIVSMAVRPTRWSCCILFYEPAPGSSSLAFYLFRVFHSTRSTLSDMDWTLFFV